MIILLYVLGGVFLGMAVTLKVCQLSSRNLKCSVCRNEIVDDDGEKLDDLGFGM